MSKKKPGTLFIRRPLCPACGCPKLGFYGGHEQGDGSRLDYVECKNGKCGHKFRIVWDVPEPDELEADQQLSTLLNSDGANEVG